MKKHILQLIFVLVFISCSSNKENNSVTILEKEKMAGVLTDLTLIESEMNSRALPANNKIESEFKYNVFKSHGITQAEYDTSLKYYSLHPDDFKKVYDIVLENLSRIQAETK